MTETTMREVMYHWGEIKTISPDRAYSQMDPIFDRLAQVVRKIPHWYDDSNYGKPIVHDPLRCNRCRLSAILGLEPGETDG